VKVIAYIRVSTGLDSESVSENVGSFIHSRSSGYPLNAFLVESSIHRLPQRLNSDLLETLVSSVRAVIVSGWDAESVVVCQVKGESGSGADSERLRRA
jgi:hypothetical protein